MAVIDTVTIGADTFSVYALVLTEANENTDSFWNVRLGAERTAWEAASEDDQNRALVMAADWLDRSLVFTGTKTSAAQPRAWPRDNASNGCTGTSVTSGTTPDEIFYAQAWLAGAILVDNAAPSGTGTGSNVKKAQAGTASVEFFRPTVGVSGQDHRLPQVAHDLTKCYTQAGGVGGLGAPTASGCDVASSFSGDDSALDEWYA